MTLQAPLFLLLLLLAPVGAWLYWRRERSTSAGQAAFASPALMASVVPVRPGWRRHVPLLAYLLALIVLAVGLARPQVAVSVPVEQARIMLLTDSSGSMRADDVTPTRFGAARRAAASFLERVPERVRVGAIAFNRVATLIAAPTRDRASVNSALAKVEPTSGTAPGDAINLALKVTRQPALPGRKPPPTAIVLLSDGKASRGVDPLGAARAAKRAGVPVYTVVLGTPNGRITDKRGRERRVAVDPSQMRRIAELSGGQSFSVADADRLSTVYERLGKQLTRKRERRQITAGFAGGGLALLLVGAGMSLFWFGRVP